MKPVFALLIAGLLSSCATTGKVYLSNNDYKTTAIVEKKAGKCVVEATSGSQRLYFITDCNDAIGDNYRITKN